MEAAYVAAFPNVKPMRSRSYDAAGRWAGRAAADHVDIGGVGASPTGAERKVCPASGGPLSPAPGWGWRVLKAVRCTMRIASQ